MPGGAPSSSWRTPRAAVEKLPKVTRQGVLLKDPTLRKKQNRHRKEGRPRPKQARAVARKGLEANGLVF